MMFINNPEALSVIIEGQRKDSGQHVVTVVEAKPKSATDGRWRTSSPLLGLSPRVAAS
jgi:hypothetical protein